MLPLLNAPPLSEVEQLRERVSELENELEQERLHAREAIKAVRNQSTAATRLLARMRSQFEPWHSMLSGLFSDLDAAGIAGEESASTPRQASGVWESWKQKLPGKPAEIIQSLQEHGELSVAQIRVAAHCGQQTVYDVTSKLHKLGLINKNGGKYSLKEL